MRTKRLVSVLAAAALVLAVATGAAHTSIGAEGDTTQAVQKVREAASVVAAGPTDSFSLNY